MNYPVTRTVDVVDDYHGTNVPDPYRWLEELDSHEVKAWVDEQNKLTDGWFATIPALPAIRRRLGQLVDYELRSVPIKVDGFYYQNRRGPGQDGIVLYRSRKVSGPTEVVVDPAMLRDRTVIFMSNYMYFSPAGRYLCYGTVRRGGDWLEYRIKNLATLTDLNETICGSTVHCCGVKWDGERGFYYWRYTATDPETGKRAYTGTKVYWHAVGTPQEKDVLVYEHPQNPNIRTFPCPQTDERYLAILLHSPEPGSSRYLVRPIDGIGPFRELSFPDQTLLLTNRGETFYFATEVDAPNGRVICLDINDPEKKYWRTVIPEQDAEIGVRYIKHGYFLIKKKRNLETDWFLHDMDGRLLDQIRLPVLGMEPMVSDLVDDAIFFQCSSYLHPDSIFRYDLTRRETTEFWRPVMDFPFDEYRTTVVQYPSQDGTEIPMYLTCRKGFVLNGDSPVLLEGYGAAGATIRPNFQARLLPWLEQGGVHAWACIRGGGEYGEAWHDAGKLDKKQTTFDDFAAAARWLIANKYTNPSRLAVIGQSWGGILAATVMEQHPELFGAVVCQIPLLDMLRHHRSGVGGLWTGEFGDSEKDPYHFRILRSYSPLHNVATGAPYPPILITCGENDQRVPPHHAYKFTATMQAANENNTVMLRVERDAGHCGSGTSRERKVEAMAEVLSFLFESLKLEHRPGE
jgi:prolyl oligopeptidase